MTIDSFTGGMFETNCFFLPETGLLIDAPQEAADWLAREGHKVRLLLLTHGHVDHVWDAARIQRVHGCPVGCHPETVPMVSQPEFFRQFGFALEIETFKPDLIITETPLRELGGVPFQVLDVPGHCPGSLCFFSKETASSLAVTCSLPAAWADGTCRAAIRSCYSMGYARSFSRSGTG